MLELFAKYSAAQSTNQAFIQIFRQSFFGCFHHSEEKRRFLTVFQLYDGIGEWYDLSILPAKSGTFKVGRN